MPLHVTWYCAYNCKTQSKVRWPGTLGGSSCGERDVCGIDDASMIVGAEVDVGLEELPMYLISNEW